MMTIRFLAVLAVVGSFVYASEGWLVSTAKCNGKTYVTAFKGCCKGKHIYTKATKQCCSIGVVSRFFSCSSWALCKGKVYLKATHGCCSGKTYLKHVKGCCKEQIYTKAIKKCCHVGPVLSITTCRSWKYCRNVLYTSITHGCCNFVVYALLSETCCAGGVLTPRITPCVAK